MEGEKEGDRSNLNCRSRLEDRKEKQERRRGKKMSEANRDRAKLPCMISKNL